MRSDGASIEDAYRRRTGRSEALMQRAAAALPGGNTRSAVHYEPYPTVVVRGRGVHLRDVDGNEYVDAFFSGTSLVHGHAHPEVSAAIEAAAGAGLGWFAPSPAQIELAEALVARIAAVDRVRLCSSGTEASLLAVEVARRWTGRRGILKVVGGYHGFTQELAADPRANRAAGVHLARFGDATSFAEVLDRHGRDIALVVLEPVVGVGGVIAGSRAFLEEVAVAARRVGALLAFDEVMSFRLAPGGAQCLTGVAPDLTILGKAIGGGAPIGALGGGPGVLDCLDPRHPDPLVHPGTFNGNPLSCAAGVVALRLLDADGIRRMEERAAEIEVGLRARADELAVPLAVRRAGSLLALFAQDEAPVEPMVARPDADAMARLHLACMNRGLALGPRGLVAVPSIAGAAYVDEVVDRAGQALADLSRGRVAT